jgi:type III secretion protein T
VGSLTTLLAAASSPTADYVSFFSAFAAYTPMSLLSLFFLGIFRMAPIVSLLPFLGQKLPGGVKMGLTIALTVIMLPHILLTAKTAVNFNSLYIGYCLKELLVGFILSFLASIPFNIATSAGSLIDFIRGSSSLQVTDPFSQAQTSEIGNLYNYVLIILFYQLGGPFIFLNGVLESFSIIPADGFFNSSFFTLQQPFWHTIWNIVTQVTAVSIQLSAPALLAVLMTEVFLGIANRLAPMVQIVFLGMSLKSLFGLAILCAAWFFILKQMGDQTLLWMQEIQKLLYAFKS